MENPWEPKDAEELVPTVDPDDVKAAWRFTATWEHHLPTTKWQSVRLHSSKFAEVHTSVLSVTAH